MTDKNRATAIDGLMKVMYSVETKNLLEERKSSFVFGLKQMLEFAMKLESSKEGLTRLLLPLQDEEQLHERDERQTASIGRFQEYKPETRTHRRSNHPGRVRY